MRVIAALALVFVAVPARADDDRPELQRMRFVERGNHLDVTASIAKLFDSAAYDALGSGFPSTVLLNIAIYSRRGSEPIRVLPVLREVVYDLWDEQYVLRLDEPTGRRTLKVKYRAEALKILTSVLDLPIARLADIPYDEVFYLRLTAQLNPVSDETLAEVRRWLSQGTGGGLDRGGVFFGSFVSVFVNPKIAKADRVIQLRSQPFYRPSP